MATTIKFDTIVTHCLGSTSLDDEVKYLLFSLAWKLDASKSRLEMNARAMAERFEKYARDVEAGQVWDPPTGWSTLRDLDQDAATYKANLDSFKELFPVATGRKFYQVVEEIQKIQGDLEKVLEVAGTKSVSEQIEDAGPEPDMSEPLEPYGQGLNRLS